MSYGGHSMHRPLKRVVVRRPDDAFAVDDIEAWNYLSRPDLPVAQAEHDALVAMLEDDGVEVTYHDADLPEHADSIFVYDPVWVTDGGVIELGLGKALRQGEEEPLSRCLQSMGLPRLGRLEGDARADGGDLLWLDSKTLVAGQGFRTNRAGAEQLRDLLAPLGVEVLTAELPYFQGPQACLHLLSLISIVDDDVAVVYPPLFPVPLWKLLDERGFRKVEVPEQEFLTMAPNVLATAPGRCIMIEGNPITQERLEAAGCHVRTYKGAELSLKAEGGPTCLTRPVLRQG